MALYIMLNRRKEDVDQGPDFHNLRACFHSFEDNGHNGIRQTGEMVITLPLAVREDPRGYYLIDSAKEAMCGDGYGDVISEHSTLLAFAQHVLNHVKILYQQVVRELTQKLGAVP